MSLGQGTVQFSSSLEIRRTLAELRKDRSMTVTAPFQTTGRFERGKEVWKIIGKFDDTVPLGGLYPLTFATRAEAEKVAKKVNDIARKHGNLANLAFAGFFR